MLPLQMDLYCLSVPELQHDDSMEDAIEHDVFSRCGSSHSTTTKRISHEQGLTMSLEHENADPAGDDSHACHQEQMDEDMDTDDAECASHAATSTSHFDPERNLSVPVTLPKRFFRTFWRSITRRLITDAATGSIVI